MNQELERAGRVADFFEFAELMCIDALDRNEVASIQSVQFSGGSDIKAGDFLIGFSRKPDWVRPKVGG